MRIINTSRINFEYQIEVRQPLIKETKYSNTVATWVIDKRIKVLKKVDKVTASVYEVIMYTIEVQNISFNTVHQVIVRDKIPEELKFIYNSVYVDGIKRRCVDINKGLIINELKVSQLMRVTFKAVVLPKSRHDKVKNHGHIAYAYSYHVELPSIAVNVETNEVVTIIRNKLFKNWIHQSKLQGPWGGIGVECIEVETVGVCSKGVKLINGKYGYQLLIIGEINYKIKYRLSKRNEDMEWIEIEGFTCLIQVPEGIRYCTVEHIDMEIEMVDIQLLQGSVLYLSVQIITNIC